MPCGSPTESSHMCPSVTVCLRVLGRLKIRSGSVVGGFARLGGVGCASASSLRFAVSRTLACSLLRAHRAVASSRSAALRLRVWNNQREHEQSGATESGARPGGGAGAGGPVLLTTV